MSVVCDITIRQGSNFNLSLQLQGGDGVGRDLTGYSIRSQLRPGHGSDTHVDFHAEILVPETGHMKISLPPAETSQLWAGQGVYDIEIFTDETNVERILEGRVTISPRVTNVDN